MSIKHETIEVRGTVLYCDGCGRRGPESAYDNADDVLEQADKDKWVLGDDRDLCPDCAAAEPKKRRKAR